MADEEINPLEPIINAPPHINRIVKKVLRLEKERLYDDRPRLIEDVVNIIKREVENDTPIP